MKEYLFPAKREQGFTLIEMIIYFGVLGILMTVILKSFTSNLTTSVSQSAIAETTLETGLGIDLLRTDLEHAGFGLPWYISGSITYNENKTALSSSDAAPGNEIPSAFGGVDTSSETDIVNSSDYLIIRGSNMATSAASQAWGLVGRDSDHDIEVQSMGPDDFETNNRVIFLRPINGSGYMRELVTTGTDVTDTYTTITSIGLEDPDFAPAETANDPEGTKYLVYDIDPDTDLRRPFNRADFYISSTSEIQVPEHCAPHTGVLVKAVENQGDDTFTDTNTTDGTVSPMPLIDCVADFQVVFYLDTDDDGEWDTLKDSDELSELSAEEIRDQVKAVRCFILSHEGRMDPKYTYPSSLINVGDIDEDGHLVLDDGETECSDDTTCDTPAGRTFDLEDTIVDNWSHYRWKVYSLTVTPTNLN